MIGALWFIGQVAAPVIIVFGVLTDDRLGWVSRPWWLAVVTATSIDIAVRYVLAGHVTLGAIHAIVSLVAAAWTVRAVHADRTPTGRHLKRSETTL